MKKIVLLFAMIVAIAGCNSNDSGTGTGPNSTDEDTTAANVHNVENANGNIPDTTNSINIGTETQNPATSDSTRH